MAVVVMLVVVVGCGGEGNDVGGMNVTVGVALANGIGVVYVLHMCLVFLVGISFTNSWWL